MTAHDKKSQKSYVFNVDLLIEDTSNAKALQTLLNALNQPPFADFKIHSGVEFGRLIDRIKQEPRETATFNVPTRLVSKQSSAAATRNDSNAQAAKPAQHQPKSATDNTADPAPASIEERIKGTMAANQLIRLNVNKGRGVKLSVPCRIVGFDESSNTITVYHVDEKKVYAFSLNEIDDFH